MRYILASAVLVVLLLSTLALGKTVHWDDLVMRDGLDYRKLTDVPFTGKRTGKTKGSYKNGKLEGPYVRYYDNGQLSS